MSTPPIRIVLDADLYETKDSEYRILEELSCPDCLSDVAYCIRSYFDKSGNLVAQDMLLDCVNDSNCNWGRVIEDI